MVKTILIIDDDRMVVKTLEKLLQMEGYRVLPAESGKAALTVIKSEQVDLIISDIKMPEMNGVETIKAINECFAKNNKQKPPFIFITGFAESDTNESAKNIKPADLLYKPFDKDAFLKSIETALKQ